MLLKHSMFDARLHHFSTNWSLGYLATLAGFVFLIAWRQLRRLDIFGPIE